MSDCTINSKIRTNINKNERIISLILGSYLLCKAFSGKRRKTKALAGAFLIYRGSTGNCPVSRALNIDSSKPINQVSVKSYITVNKPRHEVYKYWRKFDNLPFFMKHLENVTLLDEQHSIWKARIPGGFGTIDWHSEIISDIENEYIAWRSLPDSQIENTGVVRFSDAGKFGTEVHIDLSYRAPAGVIGANVAKLLNPLLEEMIKEDIKNFRRYIDTGELPTIEGQASGKNK